LRCCRDDSGICSNALPSASPSLGKATDTCFLAKLLARQNCLGGANTAALNDQRLAIMGVAEPLAASLAMRIIRIYNQGSKRPTGNER